MPVAVVAEQIIKPPDNLPLLDLAVLAVVEQVDSTLSRLMLPLELLELLIQAVVAVGLQMALRVATAAPAS
jgi:hypothetical protein